MQWYGVALTMDRVGLKTLSRCKVEVPSDLAYLQVAMCSAALVDLQGARGREREEGREGNQHTCLHLI